jgi:hypothetical protein
MAVLLANFHRLAAHHSHRLDLNKNVNFGNPTLQFSHQLIKGADIALRGNIRN